MKEKKILIACNNLDVGGVQRALINLLQEINNAYDITLFLFYAQDLRDVPPNVRIIGGNRFNRILGMSQAQARALGPLTAMWRGFWVIVTKLFGCKIPFDALCRLQSLPEEYDVAISYMQNSDYRFFYGGCNEFVVKSVKSSRKISYVHCDFQNYLGNNKYNIDFYKHFDGIACVSASCKRVFDACCPQYSKKTMVAGNFCNYHEILNEAVRFEVCNDAVGFRILSVARISPEKGILRMIPIFAKLKEEGFQFTWSVVGDGPQLKSVKQAVAEYGLCEEVLLYGQQKNPYPFYKKADLLLVPSYNEAAPMVYNEANVLGVPILTTNTTSAIELVQNKGIGIVCENTEEGLYFALKKILSGEETDVYKNTGPYHNKDAMRDFERVVRQEEIG